MEVVGVLEGDEDKAAVGHEAQRQESPGVLRMVEHDRVTEEVLDVVGLEIMPAHLGDVDVIPIESQDVDAHCSSLEEL